MRSERLSAWWHIPSQRVRSVLATNSDLLINTTSDRTRNILQIVVRNGDGSSMVVVERGAGGWYCLFWHKSETIYRGPSTLTGSNSWWRDPKHQTKTKYVCQVRYNTDEFWQKNLLIYFRQIGGRQDLSTAGVVVFKVLWMIHEL